jgi:hypothetical protein
MRIWKIFITWLTYRIEVVLKEKYYKIKNVKFVRKGLTPSLITLKIVTIAQEALTAQVCYFHYI